MKCGTKVLSDVKTFGLCVRFIWMALRLPTSFHLCICFFFLQCVICFGGTEKLGRTKTTTRDTVPFAPLQGNHYRSQSFLLSLPSSSLFSQLFCLLLLLSVSHPFSGRTPDELVLQAHSLRLIELHKKIVEWLMAKGKRKKPQLD